MATKKETANAQRQAKAIVTRTAEQAINLLEELLNKVDRAEWLSTTKNGALKLTTARPQLAEDNKGTLTCGGTTYYLVSAGETKTALLISFRSYLVFVIHRENVAKRLAEFPTFEDWCKKQVAQWEKLAAVGVEITEEQKKAMYANARAKLGTLDTEDAEEV